MAQDHIRYDVLTQDALRGVVRKVLSEVEKAGPPGDHHFFISFATRAPGVRISKKLLDQYKDEMTIVIQNQYHDLKTSETGFEIGLSFDGVAELLVIPFSSLKGFFDPSVEFGMQFEPERSNFSSEEKSKKSDKSKSDNTGQTGEKTDGEADGETTEETGEKVVSLDSFRKK
ncbi:MAG: ClpXP protease specificity-enhancing factor SspB [Devosiaceae bacterium]|nr:ClpXP protease specificity-enhancing factor SspB [Devosiaceae bacterium]